MHRLISILVFITFGFGAFCQNKDTEKLRIRKYYGAESYLIEGSTFADSLKENPFDRLPLDYKKAVPNAVWEISKASAGLSVRFFTNSTSIKIKWNLLNNERDNFNLMSVSNMAATGVYGIDLYCKIKGQWQFISTARPSGKINYFMLIENMKPEMREFRMYMPLYDGVSKLRIGIDSVAVIKKPEPDKRKPIVFYGTSITQGSAASRPGMAYVNILSRLMDAPIVNLGFSGNGKMDGSVCRVMGDIDAAFYVIDGTANMTADEIETNAVSLVEILKNHHPDTPIVFIEGLMDEKGNLDDSTRTEMTEKNETLHQEFKKMLAKGMKHIFYISNKEMAAPDHEGTVDGVHLTDLGAMRFAKLLEGKFRKLGLKVN